MLVLSRQRDETIMIGDDIEITIVDIRGDKVRLGITAPATIPVHRKEVYDAIQRENREAARVKMEDLGLLAQDAGTLVGPAGAPPGPAGRATNTRAGRTTADTAGATAPGAANTAQRGRRRKRNRIASGLNTTAAPQQRRTTLGRKMNRPG